MAYPSQKLNRRVAIQRPATVGDGEGGRTRGWEDAGTVWCELIPLRGGEAMTLGIQRGTQLWRATIRFRADISIQHRLVWEGRSLDIRTCEEHPDYPRQAIVMTCESGTVE